jgi:hypothetical protein
MAESKSAYLGRTFNAHSEKTAEFDRQRSQWVSLAFRMLFEAQFATKAILSQIDSPPHIFIDDANEITRDRNCSICD